MARFKFVVEGESNYAVTPTALLSDWIESSVGRDPARSGITSVSVTPMLPDPMDAHGEHGVADGLADGSGYAYSQFERLGRIPVVTVGPTPIHQPKERPTTCTCGMGVGSTADSHFPYCPLHPRYVDTGLSDADRTPQDIHSPRMDDAEQDGQGKDVEAEHTGTLTLVKTWRDSNGTLHSRYGFQLPVGDSPSCDRCD